MKTKEIAGVLKNIKLLWFFQKSLKILTENLLYIFPPKNHLKPGKWDKNESI